MSLIPIFSPAGGPLELALFSQAEGATTTITIPSCQDGDFGVFITCGSGGSGGSAPSTLSTPSGWTSVVNVTYSVSGDKTRLQAFIKIMADADSGASLTCLNGSNNEANMVLIFRGNYEATTIGYGDAGGEVTSGDPAAVTLTCSNSTGTSTIAFCSHYTRSGGTRACTLTPTRDSTYVNTDDRLTTAWRIDNDTAGQDGDADTNDNGTSNSFIAFWAEIT